jgi:hypothetical protein
MPATEEAPRGVVAPEYGPSAPELLRRRFGRRGSRIALALAGLVVVAIAVLLVAGAGEDVTQLDHRPDPQFTLLYGEGIRPVKARSGELVRLHSRRGRVRMEVTVSRLRLPAYQGSVGGLLPVLADRRAAALARELPGFRYERDGKARVNDAPGYQLRYSSGRTTGIDLMIVPEDGDREGVLLRYRQTGTARNERQRDLVKATRSAFRSFRFGLDRP